MSSFDPRSEGAVILRTLGLMFINSARCVTMLEH